MVIASTLWRRLGTPGHDACRLEQGEAGWRLQGTAIFRHVAGPAQLAYVVMGDLGWYAVQGQVCSWLGLQSVEFTMGRTNRGVWILNGAAMPGLERYVDLNLGFTPATSLLQLRRLALAEGQAADASVVRLDVSAGTLTVLLQRYERRAEANYWYEAPRVHYAGLLEVTATGFIRRYPGLWGE